MGEAISGVGANQNPDAASLIQATLAKTKRPRNCRAQQSYFFSARSFRMTANGFGAGALTSLKVLVS